MILQILMIRYIKNEEHYNLLLEQIANVRHTLWIGTADLKDWGDNGQMMQVIFYVTKPTEITQKFYYFLCLSKLFG